MDKNQGMEILVLPHVHSDLCWPDIPDLCVNLCMLCIDDTVAFSSRTSAYKFTMEHIMFLQEYLRRNPHKRDEIKQLMLAGNLDCGATHSGSTELTIGGEALIRGLYSGKLWLENDFGIAPNIAWNVDAPGHTAQLPQILAKAGVDTLYFWKTFPWKKNYGGYAGPYYFKWEALDGSQVTSIFTPYSYGLGNLVCIKEDYELFESAVQPYIEKIHGETMASGIPPYVLIADGHDCARPSFASVLNINKWNENHPDMPMRLVSSTDFAEMLRDKPLPVSKGEMPCWWDTVMTFETERVLADRWAEGALLSAECTAAIAAAILPEYEVPKYDLQSAWEARLFAGEHNEGGNRGDLSDTLKVYKTKAALHISAQTGRRALGAIAECIKEPLDTGCIVFNSLTWPRKCNVVLNFEFMHSDFPPYDPFTNRKVVTERKLFDFTIVDDGGKEVPAEVMAMERGTDGSIRKATALVSVDVEGGQYRTFALKSADASPVPTVTEGRSFIENEFYKVQMDSSCGALSSIFDKRRNRELLDTSKYLGAELLTNEDLAHDENEEFMGKYWRMKDYPASISASKSPARIVLESVGEMIGCERTLQVILYPDSDRIDINLKVDWKGVRDLNMRIALPFDLNAPEVHYGVPFGWVKLGDEHPDCPHIHPSIRGTRDWFDLSDSDFGVTVATEVIPVDFADRIDPIGEKPLAQPMLIRSTYSCFDYIFREHMRPVDADTDTNMPCQFNKGGQHEFHFILYPHDGVVNPAVAARQAWEMLHHPVSAYIEGENMPCSTIVRAFERCSRTGKGSLATRGSFVSSKSDEVIHTLTKLAEDGDGMILRMYDASGKGGRIAFEFFADIESAFLTDIIEKNVKPIEHHGKVLGMDVAPFAIETIRVKLAGRN